MTGKQFSILTGGYGYRLIEKVWNEVGRRTGFEISHIPDPSLFPTDTPRRHLPVNASRMFYLFEVPQKSLPKADMSLLVELEGEAGPTIHNVILGDNLLSRLRYSEALDYISAAAHRFRDILSKAKPDVVLSGYDGFQSTLLMLVCRTMGIPWFALTYLPMPKGMMGFSPVNVSKGVRAFGPVDPESITEQAEQAIAAFERRFLATHVPESENSLSNIFRFVPLRLGNAASNLKSMINGNWDRYTRRSLLDSAKDYARRRRNYIFNKKIRMIDRPPSTPFAFFGFHMQPEMGIDVWTPFYSNQFHVIDCISRALPPSHKLLVKLHRIDSDNWSNAQLSWINAKPAVEIVSPQADTYEFMRRADLVFSIQGTIALESALLGRKVIAFGETMYEDMPTVTRVVDVTDLPRLVRKKLNEPAPTRLEIQRGLEKLLTRFRKGLYNNWQSDPADSQLDAFCTHLSFLRSFVQTSDQVHDN